MYSRGELLQMVVRLNTEERDRLMDTGAFNQTIRGYMVLTLKELGYTAEQIITAQETMDNILLKASARTAKQADRELKGVKKNE